MGLNNREHTKLSFLADALVVNPRDADKFLAIMAPTEESSPEYVRRIAALKEFYASGAWMPLYHRWDNPPAQRPNVSPKKSKKEKRQQCEGLVGPCTMLAIRGDFLCKFCKALHRDRKRRKV